MNNNLIERYKKIWSRVPLQKIKNDYFKPDNEIKDFIFNFLRIYNKTCSTVRIKDGVETGYKGALRSMQDMYALVRHYYPRTRFEDFVKIIGELIKERKIYGCHFCTTVNRYVFNTNYGIKSNDDYLSSFYLKDKLSHLLKEVGYEIS